MDFSMNSTGDEAAGCCILRQFDAEIYRCLGNDFTVIRIKKDRAEGLSGGIEAKEHGCSFRLIPRRSSLNKKASSAKSVGEIEI